MEIKEALMRYCLRQGDNAMIFGHRLTEWCAKGPILEEDIAISNMALDLFGQCRILYTQAGELEGKGRTEDDFAYLRNEHEFQSVWLVELINGNFADTMARIMLYSTYNWMLCDELAKSPDEKLAAYGAKARKELAYHMRHSSEWVVRLGDGTEESHTKMQDALNYAWSYRHEMMEVDEVEQTLIDAGIIVDPASLKEAYEARLREVIERATLETPEDNWIASGGRQGRHSEAMGHILAEFQTLARAYPDASW
ncbi:phenylacetate-CoA oxygenase subunit PaaC [bacterium SCSIO 12741]|nr:phenylacetate-CoA oxygenase subunit PaaC [bacterium SCSIO 12741]